MTYTIDYLSSLTDDELVEAKIVTADLIRVEGNLTGRVPDRLRQDMALIIHEQTYRRVIRMGKP